MLRQFLLNLKPRNFNIKTLFFGFGLLVFLASCEAAKPSMSDREAARKAIEKLKKYRDLEVGGKSNTKSSSTASNSRLVQNILNDAEKYLGVPYKFGGNSSAGFDCSGFTVKVFAENDFKLPRRSSDQATTGKRIDLKSVRPGDLLFFATSGGSRVSHVGIVHDVKSGGEITFIHASTSKGVIISSIKEKYWNNAYLHATRVL